MKTKIYEGIILLAIILIELFGFNNEYKYTLFSCISPAFEQFFIQNITGFKFFSILILLVLIVWMWVSLKRNNNDPLFIIFLIKGFQVKGSDWIGVFNIMFTLISISWIGIELYAQNLNGLLNAAIFTCFMFLYPLIIAYFFLPVKPDRKEGKSKVLITALSNINEVNLRKCMEEMEKPELKTKWKDPVFMEPNGELKKFGPFIFGPWNNIDPIRKSIIKHKGTFEEIHLITSLEVADSIRLLPDDLKPDILIKSFLTKNYPKSKVEVFIVQDGISGNEMGMTGIGLENLIRKIIARNYKDEDILFSITGGTVAISGAMILKAIPGGRKAEYARQDTGLIEDIPLSIYDVKELWNELLEKVG